MGVRLPGLGSGIDPKLIDQLVEVQKLPIAAAKKRQEVVKVEKEEFSKLDKMLTELDGTLTSLKTRTDFYKLKFESSHPDILDGVVKSGGALLGSYEFEVRDLAKSEKELAYGFPDKDTTPVGFGYMEVEREDGDPFEVVIEPGATLQDVANQINSASAGLRAMVINTGYKPDSYRLLVVSEKSGQESKVKIEADTTYLEFKEQVTGRNLDVLFEDVPITDNDNILDELLDGVVFYAKKSEPGTRVQVNITYDVDKTVEAIKSFIDKYNEITDFVHGQSTKSEDGKYGVLAGNNSVRSVMRSLQGNLSQLSSSSSKFRILADLGIVTDSKSGKLNFDDAKVRAALAEDYEGVANIFIRSEQGEGIAERMAQSVKRLRDPGAGPIKSRIRGLESVLKNSDKDIERKERVAESKEESIRKRFTALEGQMSKLNSQGSYLAARFGGGGDGGAGGGA